MFFVEVLRRANGNLVGPEVQSERQNLSRLVTSERLSREQTLQPEAPHELPLHRENPRPYDRNSLYRVFGGRMKVLLTSQPAAHLFACVDRACIAVRHRGVEVLGACKG